MCGFLVFMPIGCRRHRKLAAAVVIGGFLAVTGLGVADTHPVSGEFTFSIGAPSATHVPALEVCSSGAAICSTTRTTR